MSLTKVLLYGLKPCDMIINSKDNENEQSLSNKSTTKDQKKETDFLNIDIKPLVTPTSSRISTNSSNNSSTSEHEASPIRLIIRETNRGRHRICISQTLFRTHTGDV